MDAICHLSVELYCRDLVGTDKRFCSPVLFTTERPAPNRNMWMGPPVPPSTTSVKEEIPQVLQAAHEQEPTETTKQKSSKQKGAKDGRSKFQNMGAAFVRSLPYLLPTCQKNGRRNLRRNHRPKMVSKAVTNKMTMLTKKQATNKTLGSYK